jgi:AcrR family transcriptional regulator
MFGDNHNNPSQPQENAEKPTKEKIFDQAINLFAENGFDAVSMQDIANAVGIKKASLYYYFQSKDQILKQALEYPILRIGQVAPKGETEDLITTLGVDGFLTTSGGILLNWMKDENMQKVWRILCIELYHNDQIKQFFSGFRDMSMTFWEANFRIMQKHKLINAVFDPKALAGEYLAFFMEAYLTYFLYSYGCTSKTFLEEYKDAFEQHTRFMIEALKPGENRQ